MALRRCPVSRRSSHSLRHFARRALLGLSAFAAVALYAAAPAGAVTATLGGSSFGFEPRDAAKPLFTGNLASHGGPVMHSSNTYAIYWDPPSPQALSGTYDADWRALIDGFLQGVGQDSGTLNNVYSVATQYTDAGGHAAYNSAFRGTYTDTAAYPGGGCSVGATCITDGQVRAELSSFIAAHSLPTGMSSIFFVLTPPGVTVCTDSSGTDCSSPSTPTNFCSYHSFIGSQSTPGPATVLYAVQPWTAGSAGIGLTWDGSPTSLATDCQDGSGVQQEPNQQPKPGIDFDLDYDQGLADLIVNEISVEQIDTITNPLMNGWYESGSNAEESDACRDNFSGALPVPLSVAPLNTGALAFANQKINGMSYYLNDQFNLAAEKLDYPAIKCLTGVRLGAEFTVPTDVNPGDVVGFDGLESVVDLGPGKYTWDFGDGSPAVTGQSVYHSFTTPGSYFVTLAVTDQGNNKSTTTRQITVAGTPPGSGSGSGSGTGSGTGTGSGGGTSAPAGGAATTTTAAPGGSGPGGSSGTGNGAGTPAGAAKAPSATEQILSRSLAGARRAGVTVAYSVNQAVAGRFELMIDAATARRLHIKGAHVAGGAAGSGGSVIIGSAILAAQKAGAARLSIRFTKNAASHLAHAHTLKISVKLTVATERGQRAVVDAAGQLR